jgi:hypothetical protein
MGKWPAQGAEELANPFGFAVPESTMGSARSVRGSFSAREMAFRSASTSVSTRSS